MWELGGGRVKAWLITIRSHLQKHKLLSLEEGVNIINSGNLFSETRQFFFLNILHLA